MKKIKKIVLISVFIIILIQPYTGASIIKKNDYENDPVKEDTAKKVRIKVILKDTNGKPVPNEYVNIIYYYPREPNGDQQGYIIWTITNSRGIAHSYTKIDIGCDIHAWSWADPYVDIATWPCITPNWKEGINTTTHLLTEYDYPVLEIELQFQNYVHKVKSKAILPSILEKILSLNRLRDFSFLFLKCE